MGTKQFDNYADLITFTRASGATYLDSDGVLKTASTNIPRIEYDADGNRLGLLVEEQRTNLLQRSEEFDDAYWVKMSSSTVQSNVLIAPDGTLTMDSITNPASGYIQRGVVVGSLVSHTLSVYAKKGSTTLLTVQGYDTGSYWARAVFNLADGTISSVLDGTASIVDVGNGVYRCSVTGIPNALGTTVFFVPVSAGVCYVWGAQLETGAFPTSYIPTSGSTATRAADVASIPTSAFGYNASEGTVVCEFQTMGGAASTDRYYMLSGNDLNSRWAYHNNTNAFKPYDGSTSPFLSLAYYDNTFYKFAVATDQSTFSGAVDGSASFSDNATTGNLASLTTAFNIGMSHSDVDQLNGHIKSLKYYPRRLSNAQLQELTQ